MRMEASLQLLRALRAVRRGAGSAALGGLQSLFDGAIEASRCTPGDEALERDFAAELIRVLGAELGEKTPTTVEEAAAYLADRRDGVLGRRTALLPLMKELTQLGAELKVAESKPARSSEFVALLARAQSLVDRARRQAKISTSSEPVCSLSGADPLVAFAKLERQLSTGMQRLLSELNRLYQPLTIATDEALAVAQFAIGGPPPPRRKALLNLARSLDAFCERAPLASEDRERLCVLAREADLERYEEGWRVLADRLWLLRHRLIGAKAGSVPPLYRHHSEKQKRRPDSLEAMISDVAHE